MKIIWKITSGNCSLSDVDKNRTRVTVVVRYRMEVDSIQEWHFTNTEFETSHPIHMHVNSFQVRSTHSRYVQLIESTTNFSQVHLTLFPIPRLPIYNQKKHRNKLYLTVRVVESQTKTRGYRRCMSTRPWYVPLTL